jgi:hypothetical protein
VARYDAAKAKADKLQNTRSQRTAKADEIGAFMFALAEYDSGITEFDDRLWTVVIRKVTVYQDGRVVFTFQSGVEIES